MVTCSFCGVDIPKGTGKMYIKADARILNFCSNKCEKNMLKLGRKARTTEWTKEYSTLKKGSKK
jgi:large subunit ribosomal protein L24e